MPEGLSADTDPGGLVEVFRSRAAAACRERALVLLALGIDHRVLADGGEHRLLVAARDATRARDELSRFEAENAPPPPDDRLGTRPGFRGGALIWSLALVAFFVAERLQAFGLPWWTAGEGRVEAVRDGQLWRVVTALGLHVDLAHLAGNVAFGALFVGAACQAAGLGAGLLLALLSGALGNLVAALVRPGAVTSVGASTAVFGALGLLAALQWRRRRRRRASALRRWTPVVAAALLLGYLGASRVHTDVLAHVTGFGCGLVLGAAVEPALASGLAGRRAQLVQGAAAAAIVTGCWWWALRAG